MLLTPSTLGTPPIYVADGDADDITIFRLLLRKAGLEDSVHAHSSGDDVIAAFTKLLKQSVGVMLPLLCILEVNLPSLDGQEVLRWIREQPRLNGMSVVMMSTSEHPGDIQRAAQGGAQCYLAKYPHPSVVRQIVEEAKRVVELPAATEWFGLRANLLLRWGTVGQRTAPS
jgi:CheY-like chemotaxis protein